MDTSHATPPLTLALETSTARGSVALIAGDTVLCKLSFTSERSHNSQIFVPLREALDAAEGKLARIVVGLGPGSYTGVRIGIAAAQALSWSLQVPVFGLPSVLAVFGIGIGASYVVCGDARRGSFFAAAVADGRLEEEITLFDAAQLRALREADTARPWFTFDDRVPAGIPNVSFNKPSSWALARQAAQLRDEDVFALEERPLEPIYLAAPFITQPKAPRH